MSCVRVEKEWGDRKLSEVGDGYIQMAVPVDVVEDERFGLERGDSVSVTGVIDGDDAFVRFESNKE